MTWILLYGFFLILLFGASLLRGTLKVNSNLFDILPVSNSLKSISKADAALSGKTSRGFYILAEAPSFEDAKNAAEMLYEKCISASAPDNLFDEISLYVDNNILAQLTDYFYRYRYALLDTETIALLESGGAELIANEGLTNAFGMFNLTSLDDVETDPFFLTGRHAMRFLSAALQQSGSISPRENVLSAEYSGKNYVMIRGYFSNAGISLSGNKNAAGEIYAFAGQIKKQFNNIDFIYSGIPFHVYESSRNAQTEISIISSVSLLMIILIFFVVFRDILPVLLSFLAIIVSIAAGTAAVLLFFSEIHILTFVFGTTLIGICVDYSIHYFVLRLRTAESGYIIRRRIFRALLLCFASTEIAFIAMFCAPFALLKQFSVFLFFGIANSFLTVLCVFPLIPAASTKIINVKKNVKNKAYNKFFQKFVTLIVFSRVLILLLFAVLLSTVLFINRNNIRIENNISSLYTMSGQLKESEKKANMILDYGASGCYFIVKGKSSEEVLREEARLIERLNENIAAGNLSSYMAASFFMPSRNAQEKSLAAAKKLIPLAGQQLAYFGFTDRSVESFLDDFNLRGQDYITYESLPPYLRGIVSNLWLGKIDENYYTCVLPLHVKNEAALYALANENPAVHFVNKTQSIGAELDALTKTMLRFFTAAFIVVFILLLIFYRLKNTLKTALSILFAAGSVFAVLSFFNIPFGFFSAAGIILIFGLGVDYTIFSAGSSSPKESFFAVKLSWITTELSFGALALSSFAPARIFGLTVFSGLCAVFISVLILKSAGPKEDDA
jgi:predicted exporter